ncbi:DUF1330 domain-containing protein [Actinomycetospora corticicola]|uniref:Uncharacterized protein (DUF1330 family) n=1 Tax=Actinomycetospora corticicola TaxID=663602 RepID=A0A7Y9DV18_9PSEU|nr:DUF1330 domain-containing protein [Actinomycetospora corticicola]NYD36043.1 uncharacterized protein (DUF1330 family) [Actinomycetospora corticicola]
MNAYAVGLLHDIDANDEILDYLRRIQATLDPYGGRFLVHGATPEVLEGPFDGVLVLIGFPDVSSARAWYDSPAYREILPLRTRNTRSVAFVLEGCGPDHDSAAMADEMAAAR